MTGATSNQSLTKHSYLGAVQCLVQAHTVDLGQWVAVVSIKSHTIHKNL